MTQKDHHRPPEGPGSALKTLLFVPASRPERIPKALASEAGAVIVDLEDAVAGDAKASARQALENFLNSHSGPGVLVRINARDSAEFAADLELCERQPMVRGIMLPKVESADDVRTLARAGKPVIPLVETAAGLLALAGIASAPNVVRLAYGGLDLSDNLGLETNTEGAEAMLDQCRYQLLLHSTAAGLLPPVETVFPVFDDEAAIRTRARRARDMGFGAMLCIHPRQLAPVQSGFTPDPEQVQWARRVVQAAASATGAFRVDGQMVDAPVIAMARRILARSE